MGNKIVKLLNQLLDTAIVIVCILLLLLGLWSMLDNLWLFENAQDKSVLVYKPAQGEALNPEQKISVNHIAWLTVDDTTIDYPVMQGKDNYEYLNKDPYGEFSLSGSIFLDYNNDPELRDAYSLIYGHHMAKGVMFGALDASRDGDYFQTHRSGSIATASTVYELRIFAVASADATDQTVFDPRERTTEEITAFLTENALHYEEPPQGERIVALSTCTSASDTERLVVFGTIR